MKDKELTGKILPLAPSNIEDIDAAVLEWIQGKNLHATSNDGYKPVPVIWVSEERAYQIKKRKEFRDEGGTVILPVMSLGRTSFTKSLSDKGIFRRSLYPAGGYDPRGGMIEIYKGIKQDQTANFQNADALQRHGAINFPKKKSSKVVHESVIVQMPIYITVQYELAITTEYQQQMNELTQPFVAEAFGLNVISLRRNGHLYECFIEEDFGNNDNSASMGEERRNFETTIKFKVLGYITNAGSNEERPVAVVRESCAEFKFTRESVGVLSNIGELSIEAEIIR